MVNVLVGIIGGLLIFTGLNIKGQVIGRLAFPMLFIGIACLIASFII